MPLVSIILPTFKRNSSGMLRRAIDSVLTQTFADFELIVVDDGSTDGSVDTIAELAMSDPRIVHLRYETNVGLPALTTAKAFVQSVGDFIAWQFDDCTWTRGHLETLLAAERSHPEAGVYYGRASATTLVGTTTFGEPFSADRMAIANIVPNPAVLVRRSVYEKVGWIDPHVVLKRLNDWDFWIRAASEFRFHFVDQIIADEQGQALQDSLGNSVSLTPGLVRRYMETDRRESLSASNIVSGRYDPYASSDWMEVGELEDLAVITFQHCARVGKVFAGAKLAAQLLPHTLGEYGPESEERILTWCIEATRQRSALVAQDLGRHAVEQQRYIDKQQAYIDQMHQPALQQGAAQVAKRARFRLFGR